MNNKSVQQILEIQIKNYEKLLAQARGISKALEEEGSEAELEILLKERAETFSIIQKRDEELKQFSSKEGVDETVIKKLQKSMEALLEEDKKISAIAGKMQSGVNSNIGSINIGSSAMQGYLSQNREKGFGRFINLKN